MQLLIAAKKSDSYTASPTSPPPHAMIIYMHEKLFCSKLPLIHVIIHSYVVFLCLLMMNLRSSVAFLMYIPHRLTRFISLNKAFIFWSIGIYCILGKICSIFVFNSARIGEYVLQLNIKWISSSK